MGEEDVYMSAHHAHPFTISDLICKIKCYLFFRSLALPLMLHCVLVQVHR